MVQRRRRSPAAKPSRDADRRLAAFIDKYSPEIAALARAALAKMRQRLPGAVELVYDNYNALAIGFGPTDRTSDLVFSITLYPRWVSLFFTQGAELPDPRKLLEGSGKRIRHIVLADADTLDQPAVQALIAQALTRAEKPLDKKTRGGIVIKSVLAKQRPRRPAASAKQAKSKAKSKPRQHK
jgi:hypothetical protein